MEIRLTYKILRTKGNLREGGILPNCCWKNLCSFLHLPWEDVSIMCQGLEDFPVCPGVLTIQLPKARPSWNPSMDDFFLFHPECQKAFHETFYWGHSWAGRGGHTITICWPTWSWPWPGALFCTRICLQRQRAELMWLFAPWTLLPELPGPQDRQDEIKVKEGSRLIVQFGTRTTMEWMMSIQQPYECEAYKHPNDDRWIGAVGGLGQPSPRPCPVAFGVRKS